MYTPGKGRREGVGIRQINFGRREGVGIRQVNIVRREGCRYTFVAETALGQTTYCDTVYSQARLYGPTSLYWFR